MAQSEIIFSVQESPEGGYEARALGHAIFTQADSMEDLKITLRDAVKCHFDEDSRPQVIHLHMVKDEVIPARSFRGISAARRLPNQFASMDTP